MQEYSPPIKDRDDADLIEIFLSENGEWQEDAVAQANTELVKRGYTADELFKIRNDYKGFLQIREKEYQEILSQNAIESYSALEMIGIFALSPLILLGKTHWLSKLSCSDLKRENYKMKFKQRILLLIFGGLFWVILFRLAIQRI